VAWVCQPPGWGVGQPQQERRLDPAWIEKQAAPGGSAGQGCAQQVACLASRDSRSSDASGTFNRPAPASRAQATSRQRPGGDLRVAKPEPRIRLLAIKVAAQAPSNCLRSGSFFCRRRARLQRSPGPELGIRCLNLSICLRSWLMAFYRLEGRWGGHPARADANWRQQGRPGLAPSSRCAGCVTDVPLIGMGGTSLSDPTRPLDRSPFLAPAGGETRPFIQPVGENCLSGWGGGLVAGSLDRGTAAKTEAAIGRHDKDSSNARHHPCWWTC